MVPVEPYHFSTCEDTGTARRKTKYFVSGDKLAPIYLRATNFIKAPAVNPVAH